jgi:hypothetical protein
MIISGAAGFFISAIAAEVYSTYTQDDLVNSLATVLTGFAVSTVVFAIFFIWITNTCILTNLQER